MAPMKTMLAALLGGLLLVPSPVDAATESRTAHSQPAQPVVCPICGGANQPDADSATKATATFARGATNRLFGWTELCRQPVDKVKAGGNVVSGIGKGVGQSVKRTLGGLGEVLTFWTPKVQNKYIHFSKDCPVCMGKLQQQKSASPQ